MPSLDALLAAYPGGLTTAEVARVLADTTDEPDLAEAEDALIRLVRRRRRDAARPLGHDALWTRRLDGASLAQASVCLRDRVTEPPLG